MLGDGKDKSRGRSNGLFGTGQTSELSIISLKEGVKPSGLMSLAQSFIFDRDIPSPGVVVRNNFVLPPSSMMNKNGKPGSDYDTRGSSSKKAAVQSRPQSSSL
jgi:hypothetical protein